MHNSPQSNRPRSDHPQQRTGYDAGSCDSQLLRLHQPHELRADAATETTTLQTDRHELASVVGRVSCRIRQHAASATTHCAVLARRLGGDSHNMAILNEIVEAVKALEMLVDGLSDYAADQPPQSEPVAMKPLVDDVLDTLKPRLARHKVALEVHVPSTLTLEMDRRMLASAIRHLVHSALATMPVGGQLVITAVSSPLGIELEVADSGPGLPDDELPRAFQTTHHGPAGASGMERAIARQVAAVHGGQLTARNCPEGGTAYTLLFPARRAKQAA